jgi:hypothetical protein
MVDEEMLNEIGDFGVGRTKFLFDVEEERIFNSGTMLDPVRVYVLDLICFTF